MMCTIPISEALDRRYTWTGEDAADGSAQWGSQEQCLPDFFQPQFNAEYFNSEMWCATPAAAWSAHAMAAAAAGVALNAPDPSLQYIPEAHVEAPREAAFASPLRVPLPAPFSGDFDSTEMGELPPGFEMDMSWLEGGVNVEAPEQQLGTAVDQSPKISLPPGLPKSSPSDVESVSNTAASSSWKPALAASTSNAVDDDCPQGMSMCTTELGTRIDWHIEAFRSKLQGHNGRPVVSPPFSACGLPNLRLLVSVDTRDLAKSSKGAKGKAAAKAAAKKGPLVGSLKLKADCLEGGATVLSFILIVGSVRAGPFAYDFSQQAVRGPEDFGVDWLSQIDNNSGNLRVGVEILGVGSIEK